MLMVVVYFMASVNFLKTNSFNEDLKGYANVVSVT